MRCALTIQMSEPRPAMGTLGAAACDPPAARTCRSMTFGTFDLLHIGHLRLLARIASWSRHLVVAVSADQLVMHGGKRAPIQGHEERAAAIRRLPMVNEVIVVHGPMDGVGRVKVVARKIELVRECRIDCVAMGSDWQGEYEFLRPYCEVRYIDRTPGISTSALRGSGVS
ncbi:MAG: adenylyltransferase/cytidyltransferase family protein [Phycisphaerales bacterium]|nr:adenylyltransferase/cytidyltransferase family protein [Phycisphaerales bacterium]